MLMGKWLSVLLRNKLIVKAAWPNILVTSLQFFQCKAMFLFSFTHKSLIDVKENNLILALYFHLSEGHTRHVLIGR